MKDLINPEKVCGFYVSSIHLATKILPFVNKQIELNTNIITFLEYKLRDNIKTILGKTIINEKTRNNILRLDWNNTNTYKMFNIDRKLKSSFNGEKINILVSGSKKYINEANFVIERFLNKYYKKMQNKKITIINCYEVSEFNEDIREILDNHNFILNTAGIKNIEEVFEGYEKKTINY